MADRVRHFETLPSDYYQDDKSAIPYRQRALDFVWAFMSTQGLPSFSKDTGLPMYMGDSGLLCPVGCLIKDRSVIPSIEGLDVVELMKRGKIPELIMPVCEGFLAGLQLAHDQAYKKCIRYNEATWFFLFNNNMKNLAMQFNLKA